MKMSDWFILNPIRSPFRNKFHGVLYSLTSLRATATRRIQTLRHKLREKLQSVTVSFRFTRQSCFPKGGNMRFSFIMLVTLILLKLQPWSYYVNRHKLMFFSSSTELRPWRHVPARRNWQYLSRACGQEWRFYSEKNLLQQQPLRWDRWKPVKRECDVARAKLKKK